MNLLYRWIEEHKGWKSTTLEKERETIEAFHDLEEAKERLADREILLCGVKLIRLFDGVK
ncbi:hypothetical protein ES705_11127 [subsurface metagenome]